MNGDDAPWEKVLIVAELPAYEPEAKPVFSLSGGGIVGAMPHQPASRWTDQARIEVLAAYLDLCDEQGVEPRKKHYQGIAPKHGWPAGKLVVDKDTPWGEWIKRADAWRRAQLKAA